MHPDRARLETCELGALPEAVPVQSPSVAAPGRPGARRLLTILGAATVLALGCSPLRDNEAYLGEPGDECTDLRECGAGLVCAAEGLCAAFGEAGTGGPGDTCASGDDCRFELTCSSTGRCFAARAGAVGDACASDDHCSGDLVCSRSGSCALATADGTGPEGAACTADANCALGLVCSDEGACSSRPTWAGVSCGASIEQGAPRVRFEVPRGGTDADFFTLPFPNDARLRRTGGVDLGGFPGLEQSPAPATWIGGMLASLANEAAAFGLNPVVLFRFSAPIDFDTLTFGGDDSTFLFIDITDGPTQGRRPRARFFATTDRTRFLCPNWLGIRPGEGSPLEAEHTYAVLFRRGVADVNGTPLEPDADFAAMLLPTPPGDPALAEPWKRYATLRAWMDTNQVPPEDLVGGSIFTTEDPRAIVGQVRSAVHGAPAPTLENVVECDGGTPSPCAFNTEGRACGDVNGLFTEVHGRVRLPDLLNGLPPYTEWGGTVQRDDEGALRVQRLAPVCAAFTVPLGTAPAGGWPTIMYVPDVGQGFRAFVRNGFAARMARLGWAVVSLDPPLEGDRSPGETSLTAREVGEVLDDLFRPVRARDLRLQAAADLFGLVRLLSGARLPVGGTLQALDFNRISVMGHGQGAEAASLFLAWEPVVKAGVLASAGGGVTDRLRVTTLPNRPAFALAQALADDAFNGMHPALHLAQHLLDPVDAVNHAVLFRRPPDGVGSKHLLHLLVRDDERTPFALQQALAIAGRLPQVDTGAPLDAVEPAAPGPVKGNINTPDGPKTQAVKVRTTGGLEAAFADEGAIGDLNRFFEGLISEEGLPLVNP